MVSKIVYLILVIYITAGQASTSLEQRCFKFTWLGPLSRNDTLISEKTCRDDVNPAPGIPCVDPIVTTVDGSWPDVDQIWSDHREEGTCMMNPNDGVCAQYTYYFDGNAVNTTYMCATAVDASGNSVRTGCYEMASGSTTTTVCLCKTIPGERPCNSAVYQTQSMALLFVTTMFFIFSSSYHRIK